MNRTLPSIAALALVAALVAGCGSSNSSSSSTEGGLYGSSGESSSTQSTNGAATGGGYGSKGTGGGSTSSGAGVVAVGNASKVGQVLVDSNGMTLYYFEKDKKGGSTSACSGACASAWPPLTTGTTPQVRGGAEASLLGTIERSDGTNQVTYAGWPLYTYTGDSAPSEANGTDVKAFGGSWYPLHPNGEKAGS